MALSNLRKPFQDDLLYLEWLLADREEFLATFRQQTGQLDLKNVKDRNALRISIIGRAMDRTPMGRWMDPAEIHELRYEKDSIISLDPLFNRSLHLVTSCAHYATDPEDLNLLFRTDADTDALLHQIYMIAPLVLLHTLHILPTLFKTLDEDFEAYDSVVELWFSVGFLLWAEKNGSGQEGLARELLEETFEGDPLTCRHCGAKLNLAAANLYRFWNDGVMECHVCKKSTNMVQITETNP